MTLVGKVSACGVEYRITREGEDVYTLRERWYDLTTHKWRTKITGRYKAMSHAMQDATWAIAKREGRR